MVGKLVCAILIWVLLFSCLTSAIESDENCLGMIKNQLKDPNGYLSNWVFGSNHNGYICSFNGVDCQSHEENRVLRIELGGFGLEGEFPIGLKDCYSLESLNLSGNNLYGTLPPGIISFLPFLTTLDLSNNSFSGEIPASFASLNILLLHHNHFIGQIPPVFALNPQLKQFSVSHNHLKGPIPEFTFANFSRSSFGHNPGLCDFPLDPCFQDSVLAAFAAAFFFPVGAAIGWFCVGKNQKQRTRRH